MRRPGKLLMFVGFSTGLLAVGACNTLIGFDEYQRIPGDRPTGSGGGGSDAGQTTSTTSTSTVATTTSSGTGGQGGQGGCDPPGESCGDPMSGCIGCALGGNCSDELAACQGDPDCVAFANCIEPCADQACIDDCIAQHPTGADLYNTILVCVICDECPVSCDGPGAGC